MATRAKTIPRNELSKLTTDPRLQKQLEDLFQATAHDIPEAVDQALGKATEALDTANATKEQPFLLVGPVVGLSNGRRLIAGDGLVIIDGGSGGNYEINLQAFLKSLALLSGNGLVAKTTAGAQLRAITAGSARVAVLNGDGTTGNPAIDIDEPNLDVGNMGGVLGVDHGGTGVTVLSAISVHNNGVAQSIPTGPAFNLLTMAAVGISAFDLAGDFAGGVWTPPAGRPISLHGNVQMIMGTTGTVEIAIFKNGIIYRRGSSQTGAGVVAAHVSCIDVPNGTDYYDLRVSQDSGASQPTNGARQVTYLQGSMA